MPEPSAQPERCLVPSCREPRQAEDCCVEHAKPRNGRSCGSAGGEAALPNDGVIDWVAIELAVQEARPVRLTWIERDIAAGEMLARGDDPKDVYRILGVNLFKKDARAERVKRIADALVTDRGYCAAA